jgi:hypothetical protein
MYLSSHLLISEIEVLLSDLYAHEHQEGEAVECKGTNGSWFDVADRVEEIRKLAEKVVG